MAGSISVSILSNRLPVIAAQLPGAVRQIVTKAVSDVEGQAKQRAPKDTGALANSIQGRMTGDTSGEVSVGVSYGVHQEFGTRFQPGTPYMRPATDAVRPGFLAAVAKIADV